jgi:hypothetical protein
MVKQRISNVLAWFAFGYISLFSAVVFLYYIFGITSQWAKPLLLGTYNLLGDFGFIVVWAIACVINYILIGNLRIIPWKKIQ